MHRRGCIAPTLTGGVGSITRRSCRRPAASICGSRRSRNSRSPLPSKMIIGILRAPKRRVRSCAMMFSRNVDLPAPVPPTMTPCFIRTTSGQSHGSLCTLYPSKVAPLWLAVRRILASFGAGNQGSAGCGQFSSLFLLRPTSCANEKAAAEEQDGAVQEDFKALCVVEMEAGDGNVPANCEQRRRRTKPGLPRHPPVRLWRHAG